MGNEKAIQNEIERVKLLSVMQEDAGKEETKEGESNSKAVAQIQEQAKETNQAKPKEAEPPAGMFKKVKGFFKGFMSAVKDTFSYVKGGFFGKDKGSLNAETAYKEFLASKAAFTQGYSAFTPMEGDPLAYTPTEKGDEQKTETEGNTPTPSGIGSVLGMLGSGAVDDSASTTDIVYDNKVKLIKPTATHKLGIIDDKTAVFETNNVMINFLGQWRDLTINQPLKLTRNFNTKKDDFNALGSVAIKLGNENNDEVSINNLTVRSDDKKAVIGNNNAAFGINGKSMSVSSKNITSAGFESVTATAATVTFGTPVPEGKSTYEFPGGSITLNSGGMVADGMKAEIGSYNNLYKMFYAKNVGLEVYANNKALDYKLNLDNYAVMFKAGLFEFMSGGASTVAKPGDKVLMLETPLNYISLRSDFLNKSFDVSLPPGNAFVGISEVFSVFEFETDLLEITKNKIPVKGVKFSVSKSGDGWSVKLTAQETMAEDEDASIAIGKTDVEVNDTGFYINSADVTLNPKLAILSDDYTFNLKINGLSINKEGIHFNNIDTKLESFQIEDVLTAESITLSLARPENKLSLKMAFDKLKINWEKDGFVSVDTNELKGNFDKDKGSLNVSGIILVNVLDGLFSLAVNKVSYGEKTLNMQEVKLKSAGEQSVLNRFFGNYMSGDLFFHGDKIQFGKQGFNFESLVFEVGGLSIMDVPIGNAKLMFDNKVVDESTKTTVTAAVSGINMQKDFGNGLGMTISGGVGFKVENGSFKPNFEKSRIDLTTPFADFAVDGFGYDESKGITIGEIEGMAKIGLPGLEAIGVQGKDIVINKTEPKFGSIGVKAATELNLLNGFLKMSSPSINILDNFTGFSAGGTVEFSPSWLTAGVSTTVEFKKENKYKPTFGDLENVFIGIPGIGKLSIGQMSIEDENNIEFKKLSLKGGDYKPSGGGDVETDVKGDDDSPSFKSLLMSALGDIEISLEKAAYKNKKIEYSRKDLKFKKDKISIEFAGFGATLNLVTKELAVDYKFKYPKNEKYSRLLSLNLPFALPPLTLNLNLHAGFGGELGGAVRGSINDDVFKAGAEVSGKAVLAAGISAEAMLGIPYIANVKVGLTGDVLGEISDAKMAGNIAFNINSKKDEPPKPLIRKEDTSLEYKLTAALAGELSLDVGAKLIMVYSSDKLFSYTICRVDFGKAEMEGCIGFDEDGSFFSKGSAKFTSDLIKDKFDPSVKGSFLEINDKLKLDKNEQILDTTKNVLGLGGLRDMESKKQALNLSEKIIPVLDDTSDKYKSAYKNLTAMDEKFVSAITAANEHKNKHKIRIEKINQVDEVTKSILGAYKSSDDKGGTGGEVTRDLMQKMLNSGSDDKGGGDIPKAGDILKQDLSKVPPAVVFTSLEGILGGAGISYAEESETKGLNEIYTKQHEVIEQDYNAMVSLTTGVDATKKEAAEYDNSKLLLGIKKYSESYMTQVKDDKDKRKDIKDISASLLSIMREIERTEKEISQAGENANKAANEKDRLKAQKEADKKKKEQKELIEKRKKELTKLDDAISKGKKPDIEKYKEISASLEEEKRKLNEYMTAHIKEAAENLPHAFSSESTDKAYDAVGAKESEDGQSGYGLINPKKTSKFYLSKSAANISAALGKDGNKAAFEGASITKIKYKEVTDVANDIMNQNNLKAYGNYFAKLADKRKSLSIKKAGAPGKTLFETGSDAKESVIGTSSMEMLLYGKTNAILASQAKKDAASAAGGGKDVQLKHYEQASEKKIAFYDKKLETIHNTSDVLNKSITRVQDQYIRASELFERLNAIKAANLEPSPGNIGYDDPVPAKAVEAVNTIMQANESVNGILSDTAIKPNEKLLSDVKEISKEEYVEQMLKDMQQADNS